MSDLISREALIEEIKQRAGMWQKTSDVFLQVIQEQPTVEAKEVVHSEWKYYRKQGMAVCKNCSFARNLDDDFGSAICCPNCGADMREKVV